MNASQEFAVGNHSIKWINDRFQKLCEDATVEERPMPTFQMLKKHLTDEEIEKDLKPGLCTLGDVLAFLKDAPEECKNGYANLFYFEGLVVCVGWSSWSGGWGVRAWPRDDVAWSAGDRVFSPGTAL